MGWIRGGGGNSFISPYVIFENGKWQNSNLFDVTISPTGSEYLSIVNGELVYGAITTGITLYSKANNPFILVAAFYTSPSGMYLQTGRCVRGADAKVCQETGTDRYSYHSWDIGYELPYATVVENIDYNYARTQAVFLSGHHYYVKSMYAYEYQNNYCGSIWSN